MNRDFRGDSLHPAILEVLDQVGLADELLEQPHSKIRTAHLPTEPPMALSFDDLPGCFRFVTLMPQQRFLEFLTEQASQYPTFRLVMGARVRELITDNDGAVQGVRYQIESETQTVEAELTIGADGRASTIRRQAGLEAVTYGSAIDVLWLRISRRSGDPDGIISGSADGLLMLAADRGDQWQVGVVIPKGSYGEMRDAGIDSLRRAISTAFPRFSERVGELEGWRQVAMLSVRADRLKQWYRPGLLMIGDAAHVMSPVAGNGINYAIADAVATANIVGPPLAAGSIATRDLAAVQRRREWPTRLTQFGVARAHNRLLRGFATDAGRPPALVRLAFRQAALRRIAVRMASYGLRPERVDQPQHGDAVADRNRR